ncbi:MAG: threonine ammonia-lyase [Anaerolineales bacterium]|nr:threonine ammonia-lyase [Anaerolineales bacterium]
MITKQEIETAYSLIREHITRTPVVYSHTLSKLCGCDTLFKLENLQMTGAFKERGALNKLFSLTAAERAAGVITASAGNHAQGVAYHTQRLGIKAKVVMPIGTPLIKVVSTQDYGAEVALHGETFDDAYEHARQLEVEEKRVFIHPFADPQVMAGQGTIGLELLADPLGREAEVVVCPIGGGGLIGGIATYLKETNPAIQVIGVEAADCASMQAALQQGGPFKLARAASLADGIAVKQVGELNYHIVRRYVDDVVIVDEDEIANAVLLLLEIEKIVVEGAGATPLAAILKYGERFAGKKVVSIISGGNIDVNILHRIITRGLAVAGRTVEFKVRLRDVPGTLTAVLEVFKRLQTNIMDITHHRFDSIAPIGYVDVSITLETKGHAHIREIEQSLQAEGYLL